MLVPAVKFGKAAFELVLLFTLRAGNTTGTNRSQTGIAKPQKAIPHWKCNMQMNNMQWQVVLLIDWLFFLIAPKLLCLDKRHTVCVCVFQHWRLFLLFASWGSFAEDTLAGPTCLRDYKQSVCVNAVSSPHLYLRVHLGVRVAVCWLAACAAHTNLCFACKDHEKKSRTAFSHQERIVCFSDCCCYCSSVEHKRALEAVSWIIAVHTINLKQKLRQLSAETHLTANNNLCAKVFPLVILCGRYLGFYFCLNSLCCNKNILS